MSEDIFEVPERRKVAVWPEIRSPRLQDSPLPKESLEKLLGALGEGRQVGDFEKAYFFDQKTGLLNRTFFYSFLKFLSENSGQADEVGLIIFDLDLLKSYNKYFGEPSGGDVPLLRAVDCLDKAGEEAKLKGVFVCRLDGDTFALLVKTQSVKDEEVSLMIDLFDKALGEKALQLGGGMECFNQLSQKDQILLFGYLRYPKVTHSAYERFNVREFTERSDYFLSEISQEIAALKAEKRPPEILEFIRRLG